MNVESNGRDAAAALFKQERYICCPRDCVSRHNGGTSGAPIKPLRVDSALRVLSTLRGLCITWDRACTRSLIFLLNALLISALVIHWIGGQDTIFVPPPLGIMGVQLGTLLNHLCTILQWARIWEPMMLTGATTFFCRYVWLIDY